MFDRPSGRWLSHIRTAASRRVIDRLTRIVVSGVGLLVLLALLLIFCYLLWDGATVIPRRRRALSRYYL